MSIVEGDSVTSVKFIRGGARDRTQEKVSQHGGREIGLRMGDVWKTTLCLKQYRLDFMVLQWQHLQRD